MCDAELGVSNSVCICIILNINISVQQQHAVSVALHMLLNIFVKLYDLNE